MDYNCGGIMVDVNLSFSSHCPQVAPGSALLMRILEDFIHLIGEAQKPFQSFLVVTNNLSKCKKNKGIFFKIHIHCLWYLKH